MTKDFTVLPGGKIFVPTEEPKFIKRASTKKDACTKRSSSTPKGGVSRKKAKVKS